MDKCKCLKENWTGWTTVKCCNLCGNPIEKFWDNQQVPITPESLEGIGFEWTNDYKIALCLRLNKHALLVYNCSSRIIGFWLELLSSGSSPVYFASIEQIQDWIKPFQSGVAEEVR